MCFKKVSTVLVSLFMANTLFGATPQEIADILKTKAGTTLKNPVIFVRYGNGTFDWLVVTSDGKYAAKLDGMNPDGTFKYTILGNPADFGLHLEPSMQGVKISADAPLSQPEITRKKAIANESIEVAITGIASNLSFSLQNNTYRSLDSDRNSAVSMAMQPLAYLLKHKPSLKRAYHSEPCPQGGSISASGTETSIDYSFNSCSIRDTVINGKIHVTLTGNKLYANYSNFSINDPTAALQIDSAKLIATFDYSYENIKTIDFSATYASIRNNTTNINYEMKNFRQHIDILNQRTIRVTTNMLFKASCQQNWIKITTLTPLVGEVYSRCPRGGIIKSESSHDQLKIVINNDTSIDVVDLNTGSTLHHYNNCLEIEGSDICQYGR